MVANLKPIAEFDERHASSLIRFSFLFSSFAFPHFFLSVLLFLNSLVSLATAGLENVDLGMKERGVATKFPPPKRECVLPVSQRVRPLIMPTVLSLISWRPSFRREKETFFLPPSCNVRRRLLYHLSQSSFTFSYQFSK